MDRVPHMVVVCNAQCLKLEHLKRNLLGQQNVTQREAPHWLKAEKPVASARMIELLDIHHTASTNSVALAGLAADHVEIPEGLKLLALRWRQALREKLHRTGIHLGQRRPQQSSYPPPKRDHTSDMERRWT